MHVPVYYCDFFDDMKSFFYKIRLLFALANKSKTRQEGSYKSPLIWSGSALFSLTAFVDDAVALPDSGLVGFSYGCKRLTCQMISQ